MREYNMLLSSIIYPLELGKEDLGTGTSMLHIKDNKCAKKTSDVPPASWWKLKSEFPPSQKLASKMIIQFFCELFWDISGIVTLQNRIQSDHKHIWEAVTSHAEF